MTMTNQPNHQLEIRRKSRGNGWGFLGTAVLAVLVLELAVNARDLYRYFKISSMS